MLSIRKGPLQKSVSSFDKRKLRMYPAQNRSCSCEKTIIYSKLLNTKFFNNNAFFYLLYIGVTRNITKNSNNPSIVCTPPPLFKGGGGHKGHIRREEWIFIIFHFSFLHFKIFKYQSLVFRIIFHQISRFSKNPESS